MLLDECPEGACDREYRVIAGLANGHAGKLGAQAALCPEGELGLDVWKAHDVVVERRRLDAQALEPVGPRLGRRDPRRLPIRQRQLAPAPGPGRLDASLLHPLESLQSDRLGVTRLFASKHLAQEG